MVETLVFLHGWLGSCSDWDSVLSYLPYRETKCIELDHLEELEEIANPILIGYSMGGRIALALQQQNPTRYKKALILSAHPGLVTQEEKAAQAALESKLIHALQTQPFNTFIANWYRQPLFTSLQVTPEFLEKRNSFTREKALALLLQWPLSKQHFFKGSQQTFFLAAERDLKYKTLYSERLGREKFAIIKQAGHSAHIERPQEVAAMIDHFLKEKLHVNPSI